MKLGELAEIAYILLQLIPPGYVTTYSSLAKALGTSPRIVGRIMAMNTDPVIVPCHRVVKSDGSLGGYSMGGPRIKRKLLELEGVRFDEKGRVEKSHIVMVHELLLPEQPSQVKPTQVQQHGGQRKHQGDAKRHRK